VKDVDWSALIVIAIMLTMFFGSCATCVKIASPPRVVCECECVR